MLGASLTICGTSVWDKNYYVKGDDKYTSDMTEAYNTLNHYIRDTKQMQYFNYS